MEPPAMHIIPIIQKTLQTTINNTYPNLLPHPTIEFDETHTIINNIKIDYFEEHLETITLHTIAKEIFNTTLINHILKNTHPTITTYYSITKETPTTIHLTQLHLENPHLPIIIETEMALIKTRKIIAYQRSDQHPTYQGILTIESSLHYIRPIILYPQLKQDNTAFPEQKAHQNKTSHHPANAPTSSPKTTPH